MTSYKRLLNCDIIDQKILYFYSNVIDKEIKVDLHNDLIEINKTGRLRSIDNIFILSKNKCQ